MDSKLANGGTGGGVNEASSAGYRANAETAVRNAYLRLGRDFENGDHLDLRVAWGRADLSYPGGLDRMTYQAIRVLPVMRVTRAVKMPRDVDDPSTRRGRLGGLGMARRVWTVVLLSGPLVAAQRGKTQRGYSLKPRFRLAGGDLSVVAGADLLYDELEFTAWPDEARVRASSEAALAQSRIGPYLFGGSGSPSG